jgi:hypothetical protein
MPLGGFGWYGVYNHNLNGNLIQNTHRTRTAASAVLNETTVVRELFPREITIMERRVVEHTYMGCWGATFCCTPFSSKFVTRDYESKPHVDRHDTPWSAILYYVHDGEDSSVPFLRRPRGGAAVPEAPANEAPSLEQFFILGELGVQLRLQNNCLILLDTAKITHCSTLPVRSGNRHMYATALQMNLKTIMAGSNNVEEHQKVLQARKQVQLEAANQQRSSQWNSRK